MVRNAALMQNDHNRPDPVRITAISAAIVANLAIFAVLMMPMSYTEPADTSKTDLVAKFIPTKVDPPIKPPLVKVTPPQPHQPPHTTTQVRVQPQQPPVIVNTDGPMNQPVNILPRTIDTGEGQQETLQPPGPVETSLSPIDSPAPVYPRDAMREGITGTVLLELVVGVDGRVLDAHVVRSSGDHRLDAAAREQVLRNWRFQPAVRNGVPERALGRVPIVFTLDGQ